MRLLLFTFGVIVNIRGNEYKRPRAVQGAGYPLSKCKCLATLCQDSRSLQSHVLLGKHQRECPPGTLIKKPRSHLDTLSGKCNLSLGEENRQVTSKDYNFINSKFCWTGGKWGPGRDARCQGQARLVEELFCSQRPPQAPQTKHVL